MSIINLDKLFNPASVALIGASDTHGTLGNVIMQNLLDGGFSGPIMPVNPKYATVHGVLAYKSIEELPRVPDLAVICTPAHTVPGIIDALGRKGCFAGVVISAGFHENHDSKSLKQKMLDAARQWNFRILGPNCVGLLVSGIGLNASFAHTSALEGKLAMISQSGALCTTILDWARSRGIGFSHFISTGDCADVDFGDLLDYLGSDRNTRGILMYVESIKEARKFMSAARAASRNKPVIIIKSGRSSEAAKAAASHTGALAGSDDIFDSAIRRAGMLRVDNISDLFNAVETLAHVNKVRGNRLVILSNGGGAGVIATDELIANGGQLAELSQTTVDELNKVLPANWSKSNPVDIIGDGDAERYVNSLKILLQDPGYDAVLVMLVPAAIIDNEKVARAVVEVIKEASKPVLTCWMGADAVASANEIFEQANVAHYDTPSEAIRAFLQLHEFYQNQLSLIETPASIPEQFTPRTQHVRDIISAALDRNREMLNESEAKEILEAYTIPAVKTVVARNVDEVTAAARDVGYPVALKILSDDISHKSDAGGVILNIESDQILKAVAEGMLSQLRHHFPDARIDGFTVQEMITHSNAHELIIGCTTDPVFGPVILFGQGGTSVEIVKDRAVTLPPLNMKLARELIDRTRISRLLKGYRDIAAVDMDAIILTLVKVSQLVVDHPEIVELDINPLFADSKGVVALDARIRIARAAGKGGQHLAISPYPRELEECSVLSSGEDIVIRPIKPEDEPSHHDFIARVEPQDLYYRFMHYVREIDHENLARFTQIDYDREMAFIVKLGKLDNQGDTIGVIRANFDANNINAEFAILVRSDYQRNGLGRVLMQKMIDYCRSKKTRQLIGQTLDSNLSMRKLATEFGFSMSNPGDNIVELMLVLDENKDLRECG